MSQWSLTFEVRKRRGARVRLPGIPSQWSLTFEVRKSPDHPLRGVPPVTTSQWSLTFEVRKRGATLSEEGKIKCRNGA